MITPQGDKYKAFKEKKQVKGMTGNSVLIIEDDDSICRLIREELELNGFQVSEANNFKNASERLNANEFDAILLDLKLPDGDGLDLLSSFPHKMEDRTIVITANGTISSTVQAVKRGAVNYLEKPFDETILPHQVNKIVESHRVKQKYHQLKSEINFNCQFSDIVYQSRQMEDVISRAKILAKTDNIILIEGETGVGKEILSHSIHNHSRRSGEVFMPINCAAIPTELVESELFGYEKGAFTGASDNYSGRFIQSNHGTLFLDEIGDLSLFVQAKLLRVIDDKLVYRLKSKTPHKLDIRIIAATNKDLPDEVKTKNFREDLFYRLQESTIYIPPLRQRKDDIMPIFYHFLEKFNLLYSKNISKISPKAEAYLVHYDWPGNVRQLKNLLKNLIPFKKTDTIEVDDIVFPIFKNSKSGPHPVMSLHEHEREYIKKIYSLCGSNAAKTAELLQISLPTLYKKLKE